MKILVNVFHPDLDSSSINSVWVDELRRTDKVTLNLVYSNYPEWEVDIDYEQALLEAHDRVIFQHPFYWYSIPPLMKKWMDDVLTYTWAHGPDGTALHGKEWVSAISTGMRSEDYQAGGIHNYSMSELLKPIQQTANLIGMCYLMPFVFHSTHHNSALRIHQSAKQYLLHITDERLDRSFNHDSIHSDECKVCSPFTQ